MGGTIIRGGGEATHNGRPSLDMGEIAGTQHGVDEGDCVKELAGFSSGDGKETKGIGIKAVELAVMAEAGENGLSSRKTERGVLIGKLGD